MRYVGCGVGLRPKYMKSVMSGETTSDWFEVVTENFMGMKEVGFGDPLRRLIRVRERFPVALHGVSLNIGSTDPLDTEYIERLVDLKNRIEPLWVSDHVCWTGVDGINTHDLLPLPYNQETLAHLVPRIQTVQEKLGRPLVLENVSSYLEYADSTMTEWNFLAELVQRSGCELLLDVNNVFVSSVNQGFDPLEYLQAIPGEKVRQIHLAGPADKGRYLIDTHDRDIREEVWSLYRFVINRWGPISTLIERDGNYPELPDLENELDQARRICERQVRSHRVMHAEA